MNVFIVGSPRSGTTLLGDVLDLHPQIARWYEPYFVVDYYFRNAPHDCRTTFDATEEVMKYVKDSFDCFRQKRNCQIVIDKSPRNSLKIPFLRQIFPDAKFIHILRDGRDTTLSINKEWQKRQDILQNDGNLWQAINTAKNFLMRQPLFVHKMAAFRFELGSFGEFFSDTHEFLHKTRWEGRVGWGPRFEGWQSVIGQVSTLEFAALQWRKCIEAVTEEGDNLDNQEFLELRYEQFLRQPEDVLKMVFDFLAVPFPSNFMQSLPPLKAANYNKWQRAFSAEQKESIGPILQPLLSQFGYAEDSSWYQQLDLIACEMS